jgi:hypothetical protein
MSDYTAHFAIIPTPNGLWALAAPLPFEAGKKGSGLLITVPAGFTTDLASIPRFARWWLNPADARFAKAAIIHDYLLSQGYSKAFAAAVFYEALLADGVSRSKAHLMFKAVLIWTLKVQDKKIIKVKNG